MLLNFMNVHRTVVKRPLFEWLVGVFNSVSAKRIEEVGPDRACAEWLMRNGAAVKWKSTSTYQNDYNALLKPDNGSIKSMYIQGIDATDSAISYEGFPHLSGCKHIEEIKLVNCIYIGNGALKMLEVLKDSLTYLEISNCANVTEKGLNSLTHLSNLKQLKIQDLPALKDGDSVKRVLEKSLPNCRIDFK